jgi:hypothetical protein
MYSYSTRGTCSAHSTLLDFPILFDESTSYGVPHYVIFSNPLLLGPNILLTTLHVCSTLNVRDIRTHTKLQEKSGNLDTLCMKQRINIAISPAEAI